MTKEEIAEIETMGIFDAHELGITGLANAMDIYAEQEAINFYVWAVTRAFKLGTAEKLSTKQLYQLYIQSKNNKP